MTPPDESSPNSAVRFIMPTGMMLMVVLLLSVALTGCSQNGPSSQPSEEAASVDQHLPFDRRSAKAGIFPTGSLAPTAIPAGTPLAVHLRTPLSSATSRPGDSFEAILDEPIYVRGRMVAPRGAVVTGRVLDARAAGELQEPGYMRLALIAVSLNGQSLPVQTSSIFVKRGSHTRRNSNEVIGSSMSEMAVSSTPVARESVGGAAISNAAITKASISQASISQNSISQNSISQASISRASINKISAGTLAGNRSSTLIGTSAGKADVALDNNYLIENKDVGVAPGRRLIFRLAQPVPLEM